MATGRFRNINVGTGANAFLIKTGPSRIQRFYITNVATSVRYVKFYDQATAPNVGTDSLTAGIGGMTIMVPAGGGAIYDGFEGFNFQNGIGIGATQNPADNDTTAPNSGDVIANVDFV